MDNWTDTRRYLFKAPDMPTLIPHLQPVPLSNHKIFIFKQFHKTPQLLFSNYFGYEECLYTYMYGKNITII